MNDEIVKEIFRWFEKNTKAGNQYIGPMYTGAFYYNSSFWPVFIPIVFGRVQLNARDSLKTLPESLIVSLFGDRAEFLSWRSSWRSIRRKAARNAAGEVTYQ